MFVKVFPNKKSLYFLDGTLDKEAGVYEYIQENKIHICVPKMIYRGKSGAYSYVAFEYITARNAWNTLYKGNVEDDKRLIEGMAHELNILHTIKQNNGIRGICERNHLNDIKKFTQMLRDIDNNTDLMDTAFKIVNEFLLTHNEQNVLVHGDSVLGNWMIDEAGKVYLFDFETAFWGDPNYDIATLTKRGHVRIDDFIKSGGYAHDMNAEAVKIYQILNFVTVMAYYCPYYAEPYGHNGPDTYMSYKNRLIECLR